MAWTNEIKLASWNAYKVTVGIDSDGDLGICDDHDYSIIINMSEIPKLLKYLEELFHHTQVVERREDVERKYGLPQGNLMVSQGIDLPTQFADLARIEDEVSPEWIETLRNKPLPHHPPTI